MIEKLKAFLREEDGLETVEYAVCAGLIIITLAVAFTNLGTAVSGVITTVTGYI